MMSGIDQSTADGTDAYTVRQSIQQIGFRITGKPARMQSAKLGRMTKSIEVGLRDDQQNNDIVQVKNQNRPQSALEVATTSKFRPRSAMPAKGQNQFYQSQTEFKHHKDSQESIQNFSINKRHEPSVKGFLSDRRFELVTKVAAPESSQPGNQKAFGQKKQSEVSSASTVMSPR